MTQLAPRRALLGVAVAVAAVLAVPAQAEQARQDYVVTLGPGAPAPALVAGLAERLGGDVGFVYRYAVRGFTVSVPVGLAPRLRGLPGVLAVEPSRPVSADATQYPTPSYGLDRINARTGLDDRWTYSATGAGVTAYVVDSGINLEHADFRRRVAAGYDAVTPSTGAKDCYGHGTHVAGTLGGSQYGVAKAVSLVAVRVLDCQGNGTTGTVIAGLDWVAGNARRPAVVNLSVGGGVSSAVDRAVEGVIARGVPVVVSAGNDGGLVNDLLGWSDACLGSPSRVPAALTVAATGRDDARAPYSNTGTCVDLWAPGTDIVSDWVGSPTATAVSSGTSMSAPHVAGVAALYLSRNRTASPAQVASALIADSSKGVVSGGGASTPNRLLFSRY